jgi:hypothetical protein
LGSNDKNLERNALRERFKKYFPDRDCCFMVRPCESEKMI